MKKNKKEFCKGMKTHRYCAGLLAILLAFSMSGCGASASKNQSADATAAEADGAYNMEMEEYDDAAEVSETDTGGTSGEAVADVVQTNEKIIYTYNYSVETKEYDAFLEQVQSRITEYGGYLESSESNGNRESQLDRYSHMVIRIPADKMSAFLSMVKENSNVTYSNSSSENVTLTYVDMQSHVEALKVEQKTLMGLLEKAEKLEDILTLQSQLTDIRYELESYESQLRVYDNRVNYSTLYLDISEVERETPVAEKLSYGDEIRIGLSETFYELGSGLRSFSIWLIVNLPFLLIWAVVIAVIVLVIIKANAWSRRRHEKKMREINEKRARAAAQAEVKNANTETPKNNEQK